MKETRLIKPTSNIWREPTGRKLEIEDVEEPSLYRDLFSYSQVPRMAFDGISLAPQLPPDFFITCTTFRDGQQARPPYSVEQILTIYDFLHRLGGPRGVIRQCEFFLYSEKDRRAVEECLKRGYDFPQITGWIRAVKKDFELVKSMGLKETGILTSASDYHIFLKLNSNRKKAAERYLGLVRAALETGVIPRCHLEDITRADIYGFVVPFAQQLMELSRDSGSRIKIRLCDTMGYGVPWTQAALPRSVPKLVQVMTREAGVPMEWLEWHGHNDFHLVTANAVAAWIYGCAGLNGSVLGIGERTGNTPIEAACVTYAELTGSNAGMDLSVITEIADYYRRELNHFIPANMPLVGRDFNVTRAGIHADGAIKNEEIYNIFDTGTLLRRPPAVSVTDKSGISGILYWIQTRTDLDTDQLNKNHPGVVNIRDWVEEEYERGRTTSLSSEEMMAQVRKHLPHLFKSEFDRIKEKVAHIGIDLVEEMVSNPAIKIDGSGTAGTDPGKLYRQRPFPQVYLYYRSFRQKDYQECHPSLR